MVVFRSIFGNLLQELKFRRWLANKIEVKEEQLSSFLETSDVQAHVNHRGKPMLSKEVRLDVYDYWISNSEVSVGRSNNRHLVKISSKNLRVQIVDLVISDKNVEKVQTKRGEKLQANRYVTNKTYRQIFENWKDERSMNISIGSFVNLKPFYVTTATVKEMEMCLCGKCLNPHNIYKAIKSAIEEDLPKSLSEYLSRELKCKKDSFNNFHQLQCITGKCDGKCSLFDIKKDLQGNSMDKEVTYYVFEKVITHYFNSEGKKVEYSRTTRVNRKDTLGYLVSLLQDCAENYLIHRWYVLNDEVFWKGFSSSCPYYVLWMDYSQNIAFKEKKQVQSAHYSGQQHTLHDTVLIHPHDREKNFLYHLSDDTNHDAVLTFSIIEDIIYRFPEVIAQGVLVIRSDNCEDQYKCCYTFQKMIELATKLHIFIVWIYGIDGHGKGIVDAMSSFGVKQPMKRAILNDDDWFTSAQEMCTWLQNHFKDDCTKFHTHLDAEKNALLRAKGKGKGHPIKGSRSRHVIACDPDGQFTTLPFTQDLNIIDLIRGETSKTEKEEVFEEEILENEDNNFSLTTDTKFEMLESGVYACVYSEPGALENFYLVEIIQKDIADSYIQDSRGHVISKEEKYAEVLYLERKGEVGRGLRKKMMYSHAKDDRTAYIEVDDIFLTNIELSDDLTMSIDEYAYILQVLGNRKL